MTVSAVNGNGVLTPSGITVSTMTLAINAPSALVGTAMGVSSISWTWSTVANATSYKIFQASSTSTLIGTTASPPFAYTSLSTNTAYGIVVAAANGSAVGVLSASATAYTLAASPTSFALVQVSTLSASLSWAANTNPAGTTTYRLSYWTIGGSTTNVVVNGISSTVTGLATQTSYFFTIGALNGGGVLTASGIVLSTTTSTGSTAGGVGSSGGTVVFSPPPGQVVVQIPSGAFASAVTVTLSEPASFPMAPSPGSNLQGVGVGVQITLDQPVQPAVDVPITVSYRDSDVVGLDKSRLILARYDTGENVWVPLVSTPDPANDRVTGKTNHFSLFQVMQANPSTTVSTAKAFPNPLRPAQGQPSMTFIQLPANARIRIYNLKGSLVKDLTADGTGMANWDGTNQSGAPAASGVYFVFAQGNGTTSTFKVAVQR